MATPVKSPTFHKSSETPAIISDFKNRFNQHQQQIIQNQQQQQQSALKSNEEDEFIVIEKSEIDECKRMQFLNLGSTIKESLSQDEMSRLSLLAKFYSQLVLNNFILTINTELFFIFQLLTLNAIEDKSERKILSGKYFFIIKRDYF
jgi:hypothetical protein